MKTCLYAMKYMWKSPESQFYVDILEYAEGEYIRHDVVGIVQELDFSF